MWCWSGGSGIFKKMSLCYSIVYYYNVHKGTRSSYRSVDCIRLWSCLLCLLSAFVSLVFIVLYTHIWKKICLHLSLYLLMSWAWWIVPWPSVLRHCWFGHLTRKIVSKMTCHVSSSMLNCTIPSHWTNSKQLTNVDKVRWSRFAVQVTWSCWWVRTLMVFTCALGSRVTASQSYTATCS